MKAKYIKESPDEISLPYLTYNSYGEALNYGEEENLWLGDEDAYPFWRDENGYTLIGRKSETHPGPPGYRRASKYYPGRLWLDSKIISFWEYPDKKIFQEMMRDLSYSLSDKTNEYVDILGDPAWEVEIIPNTENWLEKKSIEDNFKTQLISVRDYQGSAQRSEEDLNQEHTKSPLLKKKREVPYGFGSKNPKYMDKRRWNMASLTGESKKENIGLKNKLVPENLNESINFERSQNPITQMGIGLEALKKEVKDKIKFRLEKRPIYTQKYPPKQTGEKIEIRLDLSELSNIVESGNESLIFAAKKVLEEISELPKKYRDNIISSPFLKILDELDILWNPKYGWINASTLPSAKRINPEKAEEYFKEKSETNPNQLFTASLKSWDLEGMKKAILNGATNLSINRSSALEVAVGAQNMDKKGDPELIRLLLKDPNINPNDNTIEGEKYNGDERQKAIRMAAKYGKYEEAKALMEDPRIDPSYKGNFGLKSAINNNDIEMIKILLTDPRVRQKIKLMPQASQKKLDSMNIL